MPLSIQTAGVAEDCSLLHSLPVSMDVVLLVLKDTLLALLEGKTSLSHTNNDQIQIETSKSSSNYSLLNCLLLH